MPCIFCRSHDPLTREHVFPASLGCNLALPNAACAKCNNTFGHTFEAGFLRDTEVLRNVLSIPNRDGQVPTARVKAEVEGINLPVLRRADGEVELRNYVQEIRLEGGGLERRGFFVRPVDAENFERNAIARGNRAVAVNHPTDVVIAPVSDVPLQFVLSANARRLAAKIALVAVASEFGAEFVSSVVFDALRGYISNENGPCPVRLFFNEQFAASQLRSAHQLGVVAHLSAGMGRGWAAIVLFGGLFYIVQLTEAFGERESRSFSIHYDVQAGREYCPVVLHSEMDLLGTVLSHQTRFENLAATAEYWRTLIEPICVARGDTMSQLTELAPPRVLPRSLP
jgi:hypothetical protein